MTFEQLFIFGLLATSISLFIWGKFRYDVVAIGMLMLGVLGQVIPADQAFLGFGHPAVITVIAILIISKALELSGVIEYVGDFLNKLPLTPTLQVFCLATTVGVLSAFMNNVGALALMLPIALQYAAKMNRSPSELLMPLSFGSLLGGLATLIGTPPNIVIAGYRKDHSDKGAFEMFDFLPVGGLVALVGILYISFIGWRLLPHRRPDSDEDMLHYSINDYITEVKIPEGSPLCGQPLRKVETSAKGTVFVVSMKRGRHTKLAPPAFEIVHAGDILMLEGAPNTLQELIEKTDLQVVAGRRVVMDNLRSEDVEVLEVVVTPGSRPENMLSPALRLNARYGVNLLAIARQGRSILEKLSKTRIRAGDVLLLQGERENLRETLQSLGCLPLAGQQNSKRPKRSVWPMLIFMVAIALTATGVLAPQIAFMCAVTVMVLFKFIGLRDMYDAIEWPVIVLLGAMIPIGEALSSTGGAGLVADGIAMAGGDLPVWCLMVVLMIVTMLLSDVINNTATAVLMAPIAAQLASTFGMDIDPFLMAVAVASSSTFLTPIGHQSNVLVMGPGGYKFTDYCRMGIILDVLIITVSVPAILYFWPV